MPIDRDHEQFKHALAERDREIAALRRRVAELEGSPGNAADTALRRANAALEESQAALTASEGKFRTLADAMPQMVWSTLPDGFHDYYNRRWYEFTGVPEGSTDGEGWNGMFHPDDQQRAWARWRHSLSTGEPYEIEYRLRHRSGEYRWVLGRALPIRGDDGEILRWFGTCTDIDGFKRTAEALRANEEFTRRILDSSGDCIKVLDLDGRLLMMSGGGLKVMEVDDFSTVEGCDWRGFWSGPDTDKARAALKAAQAGGTGRFQGFTPTAKGTPKWWDVVVTPINGADGRPERILSISRDMTETKLAEEAVREREERYRLAARATNDAIWGWDLTTDTILWNEAVHTLFGYAEGEVGTTGTWWKENIHPDDRARVVAEIDRVTGGTGDAWQAEYRFRRRDGTYAAVLDRGYLLRDTAGAPLRMIGAMLDLSERKRHEEALELLNREMDHRIKNLFAVATSLTTLAARQATTPAELAHDLRERFAMLARVHGFVRMGSGEIAPPTLGELVRALLGPYHEGLGAKERIEIDCLGVPVGPRSTTAVALIIHELATNAAKYGALSAPDGRLHVACSSDATTATIVWREHGGPAVTRPADGSGFGSTLVRRSVSDQLNGSLRTQWNRGGIEVTLTADRERLAA